MPCQAIPAGRAIRSATGEFVKRIAQDGTSVPHLNHVAIRPNQFLHRAFYGLLFRKVITGATVLSPLQGFGCWYYACPGRRSLATASPLYPELICGCPFGTQGTGICARALRRLTHFRYLDHMS